MRVLLVSANQERSPDPVAPLGVCYVATAAAEAGHEVHVIDLCFSEDPPADVRAAVAAHRPEAIGISLRNVDNCAYPDTVSYLPHYRAVVQACRTASEAPIVLGGSAFTTMPAHYLAALDVPYGVVGEGEAAFPALLARLAAGASARGLAGIAVRDAATAAVEVAPTAWLPAVDAVRADRRWIDNRRYFEQGGMGNLQTKRGCHYKCTFCAYPVIEGRGMRTRDPEGIAAEVAALLDAHGIDQFFVVDSVFNAPRGYAERVCAALRPLGQRVRWSCFVTPGNFSGALLDAMIAAGCQSIDFGTDAGSDRTLRATAVTAMCGVRVYPETPIALALLARGEVPGVEALYEPWFYLAPAVREGLAERVREAARARGNWLLPGMKVNDEERLFARLRGRGLKGDLWRYVSRLRLGRALAAAE